MVKALHQAGIEVILDVVFNHTGEGDHLGPTISFKGIDNSIYYVLDPTNKQRYIDYSGCGNTFKSNHPLAVKLITDCREYWGKEMHVDGFRFDEGSILARGGDGRLLPYPPVLWYIELDEVRRTQQGNNNAYCQDNEISWFDWKLVEKHTGMLRFFKLMIAFRKNHPNLRRERFFTGKLHEGGVRDIDWHGCQLFNPNWHDPNTRVLAFTIWGLWLDDDIHVMLNMEQTNLDFELPPLLEKRWLKVLDTALPSPMDIGEPGKERVIPGGVCHVQKHSVVVLISG